jgi:Ca2+-binding EF-hand superfamily protein
MQSNVKSSSTIMTTTTSTTTSAKTTTTTSATTRTRTGTTTTTTTTATTTTTSTTTSATTSTITSSSSSSSSSSSNKSQLEGIFHICDDEKRNNLDRRQLERALSLIGMKPSKRNNIIKSMITSSAISAPSSLNKAKKRASFKSDEINLETFLEKTLPEVDHINTEDFDSLLNFIKGGIDNKIKYSDDEYISIDDLRHMLMSQSASSLSSSEVSELLSGISAITGDKVQWKYIVESLCWKNSIS